MMFRLIRTSKLKKLLQQDEEITYWAQVAEGTKHDHRCRNHFTSASVEADECLRCRLEKAETELKQYEKWHYNLIEQHTLLGKEYGKTYDLLKRIQAWDQLPNTGDGPFWIKEIKKVLGEE